MISCKLWLWQARMRVWCRMSTQWLICLAVDIGLGSHLSLKHRAEREEAETTFATSAKFYVLGETVHCIHRKSDFYIINHFGVSTVHCQFMTACLSRRFIPPHTTCHSISLLHFLRLGLGRHRWVSLSTNICKPSRSVFPFGRRFAMICCGCY